MAEYGEQGVVRAGDRGVPELLDALDRNGILKCFEHRNTQDQYSITKPDPRYFVEILGAAGASPSTSVMVGDRIDKDVIPAKMVGMKTVLNRVGMHRGQQPRTLEECPDAVIERISDLPGALLGTR